MKRFLKLYVSTVFCKCLLIYIYGGWFYFFLDTDTEINLVPTLCHLVPKILANLVPRILANLVPPTLCTNLVRRTLCTGLCHDFHMDSYDFPLKFA